MGSMTGEETEAQGDHVTCPGMHSPRRPELQSPLQSGPRVQAPSPRQHLSLGLQCQRISRASCVDGRDWLEVGGQKSHPSLTGKSGPGPPDLWPVGFSKCAPPRVSPAGVETARLAGAPIHPHGRFLPGLPAAAKACGAVPFPGIPGAPVQRSPAFLLFQRERLGEGPEVLYSSQNI